VGEWNSFEYKIDGGCNLVANPLTAVSLDNKWLAGSPILIFSVHPPNPSILRIAARQVFEPDPSKVLERSLQQDEPTSLHRVGAFGSINHEAFVGAWTRLMTTAALRHYVGLPPVHSANLCANSGTFPGHFPTFESGDDLAYRSKLICLTQDNVEACPRIEDRIHQPA